jgi:uncharacterized protein
MTTDRFEVRPDPAHAQYLLIDHGADGSQDSSIGVEQYVDLDRDDVSERILFHTAVSEDYAGQGLASVLVEAVVEDVIAGGRKIVPVCPYVAKWLPKHPEYDDHVVRPTSAHLDAVRAVTR